MKIQVPETEDPALYRLPLITSDLYIFCAYLPLNLHNIIKASTFSFSSN